MFLFFSHKLTPLQIEEAKKLGVEEFVYLPKNLQDVFSNVPPDVESLGEYLKPLFLFLMENSKSGDYVLIQGEFGVVYRLVSFAKILDLIPIYATTKRITKEIVKDAKIVKISEFKHIRFRKY